jgi:hypothetical protein
MRPVNLPAALDCIFKNALNSLANGSRFGHFN